MITKTLYICEICNTEYGTREEAEECEKSHLQVNGIESAEYIEQLFLGERMPYPSIVNVKFSDNTVMPYQFGPAARHRLEIMIKEKEDKKGECQA